MMKQDSGRRSASLDLVNDWQIGAQRLVRLSRNKENGRMSHALTCTRRHRSRAVLQLERDVHQVALSRGEAMLTGDVRRGHDKRLSQGERVIQTSQLRAGDE